MISNDTTQITQESVTGEEGDGGDDQGKPEENSNINISLDEETYIWPQFFSRIRETFYLDSSSSIHEQSFSPLQMVSLPG